MADRVRVRELSSDEGMRLVRILRRSQGSAVTWRRAQMVSLSGQGMDVAQIAPVAFTSEDRVRAVIHNFKRRWVRLAVWSLAKLADYVVNEGVVDDISHEGLLLVLREEGVSFKR